MKNFFRHTQETVLLALVGVLAGVAIYTEAYDVSGQLVEGAVAADYVPAEMTFRSDVLTSEAQFGLSTFSGQPQQEQVEALLLDPTIPASIEVFSAFNTHIGNEVALFWEKPEGVDAVNIGRQQKQNEGGFTQTEWIQENVTDESYMDNSVKNNVEYRYTVVSANTVDGIQYLAQAAPSAFVIPFDDIPPRAPSNVQVQPVVSPDGNQLIISWEPSTSEDFESTIIYRSEQFGSRGTSLAKIDKNTVPEYIDSDAKANVTYYYTVVAYDTAGNGSSVNFTLPQPGNDNPFAPVQQGNDNPETNTQSE